MIVGCLGDIVFSVSSNEVNTISNVKWNSTAKYAELDRHLNDPLLEFTGNDADEFTFSMYFSTFLGVNPMGQIVKLLNAKREGRVMPLVIGAKAYGKHKWVITSVKFGLKQYNNHGELIAADAAVSLKAYSAG